MRAPANQAKGEREEGEKGKDCAATLLIPVKARFYPKTIEKGDLELRLIKYNMIFS